LPIGKPRIGVAVKTNLQVMSKPQPKKRSLPVGRLVVRVAVEANLHSKLNPEGVAETTIQRKKYVNGMLAVMITAKTNLLPARRRPWL